MFRTLLIANRGEIAVRIVTAAKALGIRTVAVYSEADSDALHVRVADQALCIGAAPARKSYLNIEAVIRAAIEAGADAVHPGYGFLSENADFARAVGAAGLTFVGPDPETVETMSDKVAARASAMAAGVPILPGSSDVINDLERARLVAEEIGYPVAVKACFGGGGRGLRIATNEADLEPAMAAAAREARAAFGRAEIFLEAFLPRPRHVEVQVLDAHGNVVHLGDRDCSVQRRHQKMIEEAPAPELAPETREAMLLAAVSLCRSIRYKGAGTVEFLLDSARGDFFFLEMNTRLQVEHGVTERVTGIDLVEAQLAIAAGERLGLAQQDVRIHGHAIEARISAEDPWEDFAPAPGRVSGLALPLAPWTRIDFGIERGDWVQPHYDSIMGKLIAWGPDREAARIRLREALLQVQVEGVPSTAPYLGLLLEQSEFINVEHFTGSVESAWSPSCFTRPATPGLRSEEEPLMPRRLSERLVRLGGPAHRQVAVFGLAKEGRLGAVPSTRAERSGSGRPGAGADCKAGNAVHSPMDGVVVQTPVGEGCSIGEGDVLLILEAMKMEVVVPAPRSGTVTRIAANPGTAVHKGQLLAEME
jgi:acetyl-CoA/propionyl-CoA carboxylase, biotin carboxylase, biotin carboxyl carrier protein